MILHNQLVECWMYYNKCTLSRKDDHVSSIIGMCLSSNILTIKLVQSFVVEIRELKSDQFISGEMKGEWIVRKTGERDVSTK